MSAADQILRAMTDDGGFRVVAARTTDLVQEGVRVHGVEGTRARAFGELLTAAALVRETMSPGHRVQAILSGGSSSVSAMVADSRPDDGRVRGLVQLREGHVVDELATQEQPMLKVVRTLPRGKLHQSIVSAAGGDISEAVMQYFQRSAQITASVVVATVMNAGRVVAAGGYVVQLLPEVEQGPLAVMTERLAADFAHLADRLVKTNADARLLTDELLYGMAYTDLASADLSYGCAHSDDRMMLALSTMGRDEISAIIARNEVIDIGCDYCGKQFKVAPEQLRSLLSSN